MLLMAMQKHNTPHVFLVVGRRGWSLKVAMGVGKEEQSRMESLYVGFEYRVISVARAGSKPGSQHDEGDLWSSG